MSDRYEFNPNFIAQVSAQQPFHGRTCGDCAWGCDAYNANSVGLLIGCRKDGWRLTLGVDGDPYEVMQSSCVYASRTPACPAFVEKGATNG